MQIEEGGFYRSETGDRIGPMRKYTDRLFDWSDGDTQLWEQSGKGVGNQDLVAVWTDAIIPSPTTRSIYLSGPMKGYPGNNYPLFHAVAEQLRRAGHRVYNPAEFGADRPFDGFPVRQAFAAYSKFICEEADTIVLLPGWEASRGANAERALADNCGVEIIPFDRLSTTITTEGTF